MGRSLLLAAAFGIAAAIAGEVLQLYVPHHDVEWRGFLASVLGVGLGTVLAGRTNGSTSAVHHQ